MSERISRSTLPLLLLALLCAPLVACLPTLPANATSRPVPTPAPPGGGAGTRSSGPIIDAVTTNLADYPYGQVPRHEKFEVTFSVTTGAQDLYWPYDPAPPPGVPAGSGISVAAHFTPDNWQTVYTQPAFYYQDFIHDVKGNQDWLYPTANFTWKARFAPNQTGPWQYKLTARDGDGFYETQPDTFAVAHATNRGFVQISPNDPRYFAYEDGTYFLGLGYNLNYRRVDWINPTVANETSFQTMADNEIQFIRIWLSQWSIFGSAWNPWRSHNPAHQGELPDSRLRHDTAPPFNLVPGVDPPIATADSELFLWLSHDETTSGGGQQWNFTPCMVLGWEGPQLPLQRQKDYRLRVRYKEEGLTGPRVPGEPYGFVVKTGNWLWHDTDEAQRCYYPHTGTLLAATYSTTGSWQHYPDPQYPGWQILEGNFNSADRDFLGNFYLAIENAQSGNVFVDYVWVEEDLGSGQYGPNLVHKPWMAHHNYVDQRNSYAFDQVLGLAQTHDIYLKMVVLEKQDYALNIFEFDGTTSAELPHQLGYALFYGNGREATKTRWLEEAWWRYLQARWGYSPHVHSWELLNEGPPGPGDGPHWILADEFGKFMHCGVFEQEAGSDCAYDHANDHLVTTSFWSDFPYHFWNNTSGMYPDVDYADQHLYAHQTADLDAAQFSYDLSMLRGSYALPDGTLNPGSVGKPVVRGETGWLYDTVDFFGQNSSGGVWLHNFLWAGLNPGGLVESYWVGAPTQNHVYAPGSHDHRPMFRAFANFLQGVPLANGRYQDAAAVTSHPDLRAWGQKDLVGGRAHLWIQNKNHTWKNVADGAAIPAVSGSISVMGFAPGETYEVTRWDTNQPDPAQQITQRQRITAAVDGSLTIPILSLHSDVALKIGNDRHIYLPILVGN